MSNYSQPENAKIPSGKSVIVCSNQTGVSKCTSGVMVDTSVSGTDADKQLDLINDKGIKYIDNRSKQGCLWIVGGLELSPFVEACKKQGVVFHFKEEGYHALGNTPVWWTKDELGTSVDHQPTDDTVQAKSNRREFISWMSEKGINGGAQIVHLSFIKQCGDYANKEQNLNKDILLKSLLLSFNVFMTG